MKNKIITTIKVLWFAAIAWIFFRQPSKEMNIVDAVAVLIIITGILGIFAAGVDRIVK